MVLLTMTASIVEALEKIQNHVSALNAMHHSQDRDTTQNSKGEGNSVENKSLIKGANALAEDELEIKQPDNGKHDRADEIRIEDASRASKDSNPDPSLEHPQVGNPISHGQVIDLSRQMKARELPRSSLEVLLFGARLYIPPPPPKPEPTSEYKALMARLRREEEHRSYERMINPPPPMETFAQRFPASSAAHAFSSTNQFASSNTDDDDVTYADIDRQMALIFNVLISIVACAGAIWIAARWWSTPARLALSMSGSMLVGIAEVVVYSGYIRRVGEAKGKAKKLKEIKEVMNTWVVGGDEGPKSHSVTESIPFPTKEVIETTTARQRRKPAS
ncbi:endoplasmic reticulum-based factor for assembly of V-ATPase-domain-containing protein [Tricladium varicosporioides]|nr:endoplasmic reticulum-based factor for assembly of V-ATPase-domain-containing protein [Hymenoscyphus varicosporioides]